MHNNSHSIYITDNKATIIASVVTVSLIITIAVIIAVIAITWITQYSKVSRFLQVIILAIF